jgi:hypothetical protein
MSKTIVLLTLILASSVGAQTYADLIAAKRSGRPVVQDAPKEEVRQVLQTDSTSAVVRIISPSGTVRTNILQYAIIYGAATVRTNLESATAESAAYHSMLLALAAKWAAPTNGLLDSGATAAQRRTLIFQTTTRDAIKSRTP